MLGIDGAFGEGGGQILRTALSLSLITGRGFYIDNIRAGRDKPGLRPQHLQAVDACARMSNARVEGGCLGACELTFSPEEVHPGTYRFDIGTAGSVALLFQTVFLPLCLARGSSSVALVGGTHVPWSPCYHYLERPWKKFMGAIGFNCSLKLCRAGYYPRGGGLVQAEIHPAGKLRGLNISERGRFLSLTGISSVSNLPLQIARRQKSAARQLLKESGLVADIREARLPSPGKGTMLYLDACFQHSEAAYFGLGAIGKPAEEVAAEAYQQLQAFLESPGAVDEHLADQLLLPLAVADGSSSFTTCRVSQHLLTNAYAIEQFLPGRVIIDGKLAALGQVRICVES